MKYKIIIDPLLVHHAVVRVVVCIYIYIYIYRCHVYTCSHCILLSTVSSCEITVLFIVTVRVRGIYQKPNPPSQKKKKKKKRERERERNKTKQKAERSYDFVSFVNHTKFEDRMEHMECEGGDSCKPDTPGHFDTGCSLQETHD